MKNEIVYFVIVLLYLFPAMNTGGQTSKLDSAGVITETEETTEYDPEENVWVNKIAPAEKDSLRHKFLWAIDLLAFGRTSSFAEEIGTLNPSNRVAKLNKYDWGLYLRPEFKYNLGNSNELLTFWVKPRVNFELGGYEGISLDSINYNIDFFFQELKLKWQINKSMYLVGGRYLKELGTSIFFNPSNPFLLNPGRLNPKLEQKPMDFLELNYSTKTDWEFVFLANIFQGQNPNYDEPFFYFKRSYGVLAEHYRDAVNFSLIATLDEAGRFHFGGSGQSNINEALLLYGDFSLKHKPNRFYPVLGHWTEPQLLKYDMINGTKNDKFFPSVLVGGSYTLNIGPTISLEYLYNGMGFNAKDYNLLNALIDSSSRYNFDITKDLANLNMARAINPGMGYLRKNYLFTQIGEQDLFDQLNYNLRMVYSIDDGSTQLSSLVEWNKDALEIYSVMLVNFGGHDTDLNRLLNYSIMLGLIYKI